MNNKGNRRWNYNVSSLRCACGCDLILSDEELDHFDALEGMTEYCYSIIMESAYEEVSSDEKTLEEMLDDGDMIIIGDL